MSSNCKDTRQCLTQTHGMGEQKKSLASNHFQDRAPLVCKWNDKSSSTISFAQNSLVGDSIGIVQSIYKLLSKPFVKGVSLWIIWLALLGFLGFLVKTFL